MRIAIAGFQHETNTFVPTPTGLAEFAQADSWPALLSGAEVIADTRGMNLPIAGFAKAAEAAGDVTLLPILWCAAEPGGRVSDATFETLAGRILTALREMGPLDAVYLDLHGAMVTESLEDGEGELLTRVRALIGAATPLVASLDMHANVTEAMVEASDTLTIYRTYPHIDMAETGARAYAALRAMLRDGRPAKAWRQADYLIPLPAQQTGADPARALYAAVAGVAGGSAELALGFTASDIADAGASVVAYARTEAEADRIADALHAQLAAAEPAFDCALLDPDEAVARALRNTRRGPVIIADVQDNPGAGASSDTTGLLRALLRQPAPSALLGLLHDPQLAQEAHAAGEGAVLDAQLGGRGPGNSPLAACVRVRRLSEGQCRYTGAMYGGGIGTLGPSAALTLDGTDIHVVITSIRNQCLDLAQFRHFGLDPATARIVCVKSTAHFRADFEPIAAEVLLTAAPGQFPCRLADVPYRHLRPGTRLGPGGPTFRRAPA